MARNHTMNVHLRMLGCRLNQAEIDAMARQFTALGHTVQPDAEGADWLVVNTCAVTGEAARKSRRLIRELARRSPTGELHVTGCYAHLAAAELSALPQVTKVYDNQEKDTLVAEMTGAAPEDLEPLQRDSISGYATRTRAFVKVQDGCDNQCTFCITTVARGASRSRPLREIVAEIQQLVAIGYHEAVLTGVQLGSYGQDWGKRVALTELVRAILRETDIARLRLSSLEPWDLDEMFFALWEDDRLCRHLHLPLQSGCDATLRRMRRRTNQREFTSLLCAVRRQIPGVNISSDVIVGFPGETAAEFAISESFIRACDFASLHVFRYSRREGTPATRMKGQIPTAVAQERAARLQSIAAAGRARYAERFVGIELPVLWEQVVGASEQGYTQLGYTENYIPVRGNHPRDLTNEITMARVLSHDAMAGRAIAQPLESETVFDSVGTRPA